MRLTPLCTPSLIVYCLYQPTDSSRCTRGCNVFYPLRLADFFVVVVVLLLFFCFCFVLLLFLLLLLLLLFVLLLLLFFSRFKFSDVEFLSLTSETLLEDDKHPSKQYHIRLRYLRIKTVILAGH